MEEQRETVVSKKKKKKKKKQEIDRGQKKYSFETRTHFNAPPAQLYSIQTFFSFSRSAFISFLFPLPPLPGLIAIGSSHYIWAHLFSAPPARHSGRNLVSRNGKGRDRQVWWIPFVLTGNDGSQWAGAAFKRPAKGVAAGAEEQRRWRLVTGWNDSQHSLTSREA